MDNEEQIYDSLIWDLPGLRRRPPARKTGKRRARKLQ